MSEQGDAMLPCVEKLDCDPDLMPGAELVAMVGLGAEHVRVLEERAARDAVDIFRLLSVLLWKILEEARKEFDQNGRRAIRL